MNHPGPYAQPAVVYAYAPFLEKKRTESSMKTPRPNRAPCFARSAQESRGAAQYIFGC